MNTKKNRLQGVIAVSALLAGTGLVQGELVFQQTINEDLLGFGFQSVPEQTANDGFWDFLHADNFTLESSAPVDRIRFWGFASTFAGGGFSNINSFEITLFDSTGTQPGQALTSMTFDLNDVQTKSTGLIGAGGAEILEHFVELDTPLAIDGNTEYWLAIAAGLDNPNGDFWLWQDSVDGDLTVADFQYSLGQWNITGPDSPVPADSAFELYAIPAPGALALLGFAGLFTRCRRRST
ncbi:MAG: hypothetical protein EA377_02920 [Phycisphaerales bacterium]|nr:MAG: hypothetical protein EA377_02920 [Phycisphaerales bacterium]